MKRRNILTALVTLVFVGIIETIVVAITDVNSRYTVSIVAREKISEASSSFGMTVLWWFVASIETVVVSITIPDSKEYVFSQL